MSNPMRNIKSLIQLERNSSAEGISLIEVLVSLIVIAIALAASMSIFSTATELSRRANKNNARQAAIETDYSAIQSTAERYICGLASGSTTATCALSSSASLPEKNDYISNSLAANNEIAIEALRSVCNASGVSPAPLISPLKDIIDDISRPIEFSTLGISRREAITTPDFGGKSMLLIWTAGSTILYQAILTPPVANWCP